MAVLETLEAVFQVFRGSTITVMNDTLDLCQRTAAAPILKAAQVWPFYRLFSLRKFRHSLSVGTRPSLTLCVRNICDHSISGTACLQQHPQSQQRALCLSIPFLLGSGFGTAAVGGGRKAPPGSARSGSHNRST